MNLDALSAVEVGKLFGVSEKTVRNWMNKNGLPFDASGRARTIEWAKAFRWYLDTQVNSDGNGGNQASPLALVEDPGVSESYEMALARKTRAEANLKELQLAKERGQVASIPDVERVLAGATKATQTQILALPSRLAPRMLGIEDHVRAVAIIQAETHQLLSNLATIDAVREASGLAQSGEDE